MDRMRQTNGTDARRRPVGSLLTVVEAARAAGVSRSVVGRWISRGKLPAQLVGRKRRVRATDVAAAQLATHAGTVVPVWRRERRRCGQRLRALREAAGLNQLELAARSGLTHESISRWETGRQWPLGSSVWRLARALGVEPARFVGEEAVGAGLTTTAAAARLGVPAGRVRKWVRTGKLPGVKVSGQWRVPLAAVAELAGDERLRGRSRRLDPRYRG